MQPKRDKTQAVKEVLRTSILEGQLNYGQKMPSIRQMADQYGVSSVTASLVMAELRSEGLVIPKTGRGTYVTYSGKPGGSRQVYKIGLVYLNAYRYYCDNMSRVHPLFTEWILPFEIISILLIVATTAAIALAYDTKTRKHK